MTRVLGIVATFVLLTPVTLTAQAPARVTPAVPSKTNTTWRVSRTPDGQPDLQGFWTNTTYTPLERPKNVNKEFFSKEEALEVIKRAAEAEGEQTEPGT